MNENRNINHGSDSEELEPIVFESDTARKPAADETSESDSTYGKRTVFIAGEDYDENKPFLMDGYNEKKDRRKKVKKAKKPQSNYKKQKRFIYALIGAILVLSVALFFVLDYVNTVTYIDEADGTRYYAKKKDNPDYDPDDSDSLKKIYCLCDKDGYTLDLTPDGYYSTAAGTLVEVDEETGECETIAVVDTEGNEQIGSLRRILMFPHTPKASISSIEVHNSYGSYTFYRDEDDSFQIKGYDGTAYDAELFASLVVSTGYTLTMKKIDGPIKDENGQFSEYGLVAEVRTAKDEDGKEYEYNYEPAWYILTDTKGTKHKVIVGDMLITEGGYYVQYVELVKGDDGKYLKDENGNYVENPRQAVYVVSTTIGDTVLQAIETLVTPRVLYPMSMNDYFDVENFQIYSFDYKKYLETNVPEDIIENLVIDFSYIPLDKRENTEFAMTPYIINEGSISGYDIDDMAVDNTLYSLYQISYLRVLRFGLGEDGSVLKQYGLDCPKYMISYTFNCADDDTGEITQVPNVLLISEKTKEGTYYAVSVFYDMIVEIDESNLMFLEYSQIDWINDDILSLNVAYCTGIKLESPRLNLSFAFDNSKSDQSDGASTDSLEITVKKDDKDMLDIRSSFTITDTKGFTWVITNTEVTAYDSSGTEVSIKDAYRVKNKYGKVTRVYDGYVEDSKGNSISVTADTVTLKDVSGNTTVFERGDIYNFKMFYSVLLYASISGEVTTEATEEELAALRAQDDSACQLKLTITSESGRELVYRFYKLTDRKSYMTINGKGNFFVLRTLVDKIISDGEKLINGEIIDSTGKY